MSWNRHTRASKSRAAENISAMTADHRFPCAEPSPCADLLPAGSTKLSLKFAKHVWNAHTPSPPAPETTASSSLTFTKAIWNAYTPPAVQIPNHNPPPPKPRNQPSTTAQKRSPVRRHCKAKLTRFLYGGPDRRARGRFRDAITLEAPCLHPACANCWKRHTRVMRGVDRMERMGLIGSKGSEGSEGTPGTTDTPAHISAANKPRTHCVDGDALPMPSPSPSVSLSLPLSAPCPQSPMSPPRPALLRSCAPALPPCDALRDYGLPTEAAGHMVPERKDGKKDGARTGGARRRYRLRLVFGTARGRARFGGLVGVYRRRGREVGMLRVDEGLGM